LSVEEAFTAPARLEIPVTERAPMVAPVAERLVVEAFRIVAVPVTDALVNVAPVAEIPVVLAFASVVWPETVRPVEEAFPSVVCPVTLRVPLEVSEDVAVMLPPVSVLTVPVTAFKTEVKKLVEVAFVRVELVAVSPAIFASVDQRLVTVPLVVEAFVVVAFTVTRLVKLPVTIFASVDQKFVPVRLVVEAFVMVAVVALSVVTIASVRVEEAATRRVM
jgi:hypothetical protein